ncbi:mms19 nucleotide excision repair [Halocaridina rubra]|uniref:MMS19 nucleotide excision repair protein n=1 Tax=Halocaridina rubra TaxID=373956 RepID=A0AAN8XG86_HALRR
MDSSKIDLIEKIKALPNSSEDGSTLLPLVIPGIKTNQMTLLEVVEALGSSLTHTNPAHRVVGTQFLADALHALPRSKLNTDEVTFLSTFFVDRFKDHHSVTPIVIYAMLGLIEQENITKDNVVDLLRGLFKEVHCQSQLMNHRRNIYSFFKYCLLNKMEGVKELGMDFVVGFIAAMDGEKDPRNLVLLFAIIPIITSCLPLGPFTEELFEVIAAYFPIDFVPPADDPFGISAEDLVLGLRQALSSTPAFAPYCIPLLQEKLDSDLSSAKLDALHTLVSCCEKYSAEDICPHVSPLWVSIRREVVEGSSAEAESAALTALTAMIMALERGAVSQSARDAITSLTNSALMECLGHLTAPEQRLMFPSAHLLIAITIAAPGPAQHITEKVLPLLARQFTTKTEEIARKNTIIILAKFMEQAAKYPGMKEADGILTKYEHLYWGAFSQGLSSSSLAVQEATVGSVTTAMGALTPEHLSQAADTMTNLLITVNNNSLRDSIIASFVMLSKIQPEAVSNHILPQLLSDMERDTSANSGVSSSQILETLAILTCGKLLLRKVLPIIWKRAEETLKVSVRFSCQHLFCIQKVLKNNMQDNECQQYVLEEWNCIHKIISFSINSMNSQDITDPIPVLTSLSGISRTVIVYLKDSTPFIESLVHLTVIDENIDLPDQCKELVAAHPGLLPLTSRFAEADNCMVFIYEGFLIGLHPNLEVLGLEQMLSKLRSLSVIGAYPEQREISAILHASLLNKILKGPYFSSILASCLEDVDAKLSTSSTVETRQAALLLLTWICKALLMRGTPEETMWMDKMLKLLSDPSIGLNVAQCFDIILKDHQYALKAETFATVRILYKQRYFQYVIGPLVDAFNTTTGSAKQNALLALSSLLPHLPHTVLNTHINRLFPVLLQGVTCEEVAVKESILSTLSALLSHSVVHATSHTSALVPDLLKLTVNQSLSTRIKALECLGVLASLPTTALLPYKQDVTRGLKCVLNDKKRVVRQTAVNTRCKWMLVGAPGS